SFLSAVKTTPEEWHQSSFSVRMPIASRPITHPFTGQAFIPSVRIFGFADTIPLHLQMSGQLSSLR
ncbi:hypothetical protein C8R44DRAFT_554407, partial [Mycena epipterygia]